MSNPLFEHLLEHPLEVQVAQRLFIGLGCFDDQQSYIHQPPSKATQQLLELGLVGLILFRHDMADVKSPLDLANWIDSLKSITPSHLPPTWIGVDEEGGLIERLPDHCFPSFPGFLGLAQAVKQLSVGKAKPQTLLAAESFDLQAFYLKLLGINLNFTPVLDVNIETRNPVIGPRSFGDDAQWVERLSEILIDRYAQRGVITVGKHAPGHGHSLIDSHLELPVIQPTEDEIQVFKTLAKNPQLPALMLAHGHYPSLTSDNLPASLSAEMVSIIRQDWGFDGVLITDDLCMDAIQFSPEEAAIKAVDAGVDILLYRNGGEEQLTVHSTLVEQLKTGKLSLESHHAALKRICAAKSKHLSTPNTVDEPKIKALFSPMALEATSEHYAQATLTIHPESVELQPITPESCIWVIEPDWFTHPQYKSTAKQTVAKLLEAQHCYPVAHTTYSKHATSIDKVTTQYDSIIWVRNAPFDQELYNNIKKQLNDEIQIIMVDVGMPTPFISQTYHVQLASGRPAYLQQCVKHLTQQL
jgi:beta-N-acetylhexosaminidase